MVSYFWYLTKHVRLLSWYNVGVGGGVGVGAGVGARVGDCVGQGVGGGQPLLGQAHEVNRPKLFKTLICIVYIRRSNLSRNNGEFGGAAVDSSQIIQRPFKLRKVDGGKKLARGKKIQAYGRKKVEKYR